jgi:abscisic-aldehyde oxidase
MILQVSIDVLTGSTSVLQTDLLYDCGRSLNPAIDIGQVYYTTYSRWIPHKIQIVKGYFVELLFYYALDLQVEGAFVQGVGFYLTEELTEEDGKLWNTGTWDYKPPVADNIPKVFNVELSNTKPNRKRILSSKGNYVCASPMVSLCEPPGPVVVS